MKRKILLLLLICIWSASSMAQVVINELSASNNTVLMDEDGEFPDWIELYNASANLIQLGGYKISDDPDLPAKWVFPSGISIQPNGFLTLFSSGKDRKAFFHHWETIVRAEDTWRYLKPLSQPDSNWRRLTSFNDAGWPQGSGGFGYGDGDDNTIISAPANSVFLRKVFTVYDTSAIASAVLHMDYDDAFVAYINGIEVARSNIGINGVPVAWNVSAIAEREARMYSGGTAETYLIDAAFLKTFLRNGSNLLAIQVHNVSPSSSDLSALSWLSVGIKNSSQLYYPLPSWFNLSASALHTNFKLASNGETVVLSNTSGSIIDQLTYGSMQTDHSYGCQPDGGSLHKYFMIPTPGTSNNSSYGCFEYAADPVFSVEGGFYGSSQTVSLSSSTPGAIIRYTTDGNIPKSTSTPYSVPILIDSTKVIRAKTFCNSFLESNTITHSFFINDSSSELLPVISITVSPYEMFDPLNGIYVKGPNADASVPFFGANFWQEKEIKAHVEYFNKQRQTGFRQDVGIEIYGNWSRSYPQKSMKIIARNSYGKENFNYQLFPDKDLHEFKQFIIRNSGTDWNQTHLRDALIHSLSLKPTSCDVMAYQPAVVYINGKYWGVYNIREKINKDYLAENHQVNPDSVDLLQYNGLVMSGTNQNFIQMGTYLLSHDISTPAGFAYADSMIDLENIADYFAVETWTCNWDWLTNNVRYWRENKMGQKWRYILWDLDNGMGGLWSYTANSLDSNLNKPYDYTSLLFKKLLSNKQFKHYFINRYADLLNTTFTPQQFSQLLGNFSNRIDGEMKRHFKRWGNGFNNPDWGTSGHGNYNDWKNYHIPGLNAFCNFRQVTARDHLQATFNLKDQNPLILKTIPADAGEIKLNTITIDNMPWSGIYFDSIPVTLTAIAKPGYSFCYWKSDVHFVTPNLNPVITFNPDTAEMLTAYFVGYPDTAAIIVSEFNHSSSPDFDAGDWIELFNYSNYPLDISSWKLKDYSNANFFVFPQNTIIHPGQYLVVCEDATKFHNIYPAINNYIGSFSFGLNAVEDSIRLFDDEMRTYLSFGYSTIHPWPDGATGSGRTVELFSVQGNLNDPLNWFTGCPLGSPGAAFNPCDNSSIENTGGLSDGMVSVYPNPVTEYLVVEFSAYAIENNKLSIELYDMNGQQVFYTTTGNETKVVITKSFKPGMYFYRIISNIGYVRSGKILIL